MLVPVAAVAAESTVKGSRFLAELFPVAAQADVREMIKSQKAKYADATHVVHAFVAGSHAEVMGMSDDGEPGGTAGRPVLDVLKGRGVTNALLTVTRWFGGTLLGTGGLVRAYGDAARQVLDAALFEPLIEKSAFSFTCSYPAYQAVKHLCADWMLFDVRESFGEAVTVCGLIAAADFAPFAQAVHEKTSGSVSVSS
ncbi:MAG: YigZ family protein [Treponemataceae bacterium]|nr:YigZ family protein [Treponemataceae bacterium]